MARMVVPLSELKIKRAKPKEKCINFLTVMGFI